MENKKTTSLSGPEKFECETNCRICLIQNATVPLIDDNESPVQDSLEMKFTFCTSINISDRDHLPKFICEECYTRLDDAYCLKKQAQKTDNYLKQMSGCVKIEYEEKVYIPIVCPKFPIENSSENEKDNSDNNETDSSDSLSHIKISHRKGNHIVNSSAKNKQKIGLDFLNHKTDEKRTNLNGQNKNRISKYNKIIKKSKRKKCNFKIDKKFDTCDKEEITIKMKGSSVKRKYKNCKLCSAKFDTYYAFSRHMNDYHNMEEYGEQKSTMCDICGKKFYNFQALQVHSQLHSGDKPYSCEICGQQFTQRGNMKRHASAKHDKTLIFQCDLCPKAFSYYSSLRDHIKNHKNDKKYKCDTCGQRFLRKFNLMRHHLTHTGGRPYECLHCSKTYKQSNDLKVHVKKTHVGVSIDKFSNYCRKQKDEYQNSSNKQTID